LCVLDEIPRERLVALARGGSIVAVEPRDDQVELA